MSSVQTNISLSVDDANKVAEMMKMNGYENRSAFIRWLIRQEIRRRYDIEDNNQPHGLIKAEDIGQKQGSITRE